MKDRKFGAVELLVVAAAVVAGTLLASQWGTLPPSPTPAADAADDEVTVSYELAVVREEIELPADSSVYAAADAAERFAAIVWQQEKMRDVFEQILEPYALPRSARQDCLADMRKAWYAAFVQRAACTVSAAELDKMSAALTGGPDDPVPPDTANALYRAFAHAGTAAGKAAAPYVRATLTTL